MAKTLDYYDNNAQRLSERYESTSLDALHCLINQQFAAGSRLLEIGCGSGRDAARVLNAGYDLAALDGSKALLGEALRLHPELAGRLQHLMLPAPLPFADNEFDGFFSIACLMHFSTVEVRQILSEICRVVRAGCHGVVSLPVCRDDIDNDGIDEHGRVFNLLPDSAWHAIFSDSGFASTAGDPEPDSLGRDGISWITFCLTKF